jgi:hypothetical protein
MPRVRPCVGRHGASALTPVNSISTPQSLSAPVSQPKNSEAHLHYVIYLVGLLALALGYLRYCRPARRKFEYHERFRSIHLLEPETAAVKDGIPFQLPK